MRIVIALLGLTLVIVAALSERYMMGFYGSIVLISAALWRIGEKIQFLDIWTFITMLFDELGRIQSNGKIIIAQIPAEENKL